MLSDKVKKMWNSTKRKLIVPAMALLTTMGAYGIANADVNVKAIASETQAPITNGMATIMKNDGDTITKALDENGQATFVGDYAGAAIEVYDNSGVRWGQIRYGIDNGDVIAILPLRNGEIDELLSYAGAGEDGRPNGTTFLQRLLGNPVPVYLNDDNDAWTSADSSAIMDRIATAEADMGLDYFVLTDVPTNTTGGYDLSIDHDGPRSYADGIPDISDMANYHIIYAKVTFNSWGVRAQYVFDTEMFFQGLTLGIASYSPSLTRQDGIQTKDKVYHNILDSFRQAYEAENTSTNQILYLINLTPGPHPIETEEISWGAVKSKFKD
jgi:hypothetical protein